MRIKLKLKFPVLFFALLLSVALGGCDSTSSYKPRENTASNLSGLADLWTESLRKKDFNLFTSLCVYDIGEAYNKIPVDMDYERWFFNDACKTFHNFIVADEVAEVSSRTDQSNSCSENPQVSIGVPILMQRGPHSGFSGVQPAAGIPSRLATPRRPKPPRRSKPPRIVALAGHAF